MLIATIRTALGKARDLYFRLQVNQRLYVNAAVALLVFLATSVVTGVQGARGTLLLFLAIWVTAIAYDLVALYNKVYDSILGKTFLVILFSLCTNFSIGLSSQLVNNVVGGDPSKFPHTIALLSILNIPIFVAVGFGALYFGLMITTPLLLMFHSLPDDKAKEVLLPGYSARSIVPFYKTTRAVQFISLAIFCGFVLSLSPKVMRNYETFLTDSARWFLFELEMYPKAQCTLPRDSRAAFVSDEKVLLAEKNQLGIVFTVRECKSGT